MKRTGVTKLAFVLKILVIILLICNLLALALVPALVLIKPGQPSTVPEDDVVHVPFLVVWGASWIVVWEDPYTAMLSAFLLFCGCCTAVILWQAKRVLDTILKECPFCGGNAGNLKRAAVCCFLISGFALIRLVWSLWYFRTIRPLVNYNALFVPIFFMGGLLCLVMSALFRQAAELKEENDLTI